MKEKYYKDGWFSINLVKGKRLLFRNKETFLSHVAQYGIDTKKIQYLGWSDGYDACGYCLNDKTFALNQEKADTWPKIARAVIWFKKMNLKK